MDDHRKTIPFKIIAQLLVVVVVLPFLPLLISWRWDWWEAWVYGIVSVVGFVSSRALAAHRHPDLLAERARSMECKSAEPWDRVLAPLVGLGGALIPLVAGLDARFGWSTAFSAPLKMVALVLFLGGYAIGTYALVENRFFSGVVRIQSDRDHEVVSSGPYAWVRHPGYVSGILTYVATPIWLESLWAFVPAALLTIVLVIRTALEDRTLQERLPGYREYAKRVCYRLLPGVW